MATAVIDWLKFGVVAGVVAGALAAPGNAAVSDGDAAVGAAASGTPPGASASSMPPMMENPVPRQFAIELTRTPPFTGVY